MNQLILPQENAKDTRWIRSFATFVPFRGYAVSALHKNELDPAIHITETRAISKAAGRMGDRPSNRPTNLCSQGQNQSRFEPFLLTRWFASGNEATSGTSSRKSFELVSRQVTDRTGLELRNVFSSNDLSTEAKESIVTKRVALGESGVEKVESRGDPDWTALTRMG